MFDRSRGRDPAGDLHAPALDRRRSAAPSARCARCSRSCSARRSSASATQAIAHLQDVYDHTLRVLDLIESQRELLTGLLEGQLAVQSNQMNRVMKVTSSWGAILIASHAHRRHLRHELPAHARAHWAFGYPFALALMAVVTIVLYRVFKRQGWL